jgi:hypothetical protein
MRATWRAGLATALLLTGCATGGVQSAVRDARHEVPAGVEIVKLSVYPRAWSGEKATWVDIVLRNVGAEPRSFRAVITLDGEPPFAASSAKPVAPKGEETLTVSTSARELPTRLLLQVQVVE